MSSPNFNRDKAEKNAAKLGEILSDFWGRNVETGWTQIKAGEGYGVVYQAYTTPTTMLGLNAGLRLIIDPREGLPIDQNTVLDRGTARKKEYLAGGKEIKEIESSTGAALSSVTNYWVYYTGPIEALLTPKKLPKIIERVTLALHTSSPSLPASPQPDLGLMHTDWPPMKAMGIAAISDHEASITTWARKKSAGASSDRNPVLTGSLKGSELKVFHKGKELGNASPQNETELRQYLVKAFGYQSYGVILGLAFVGYNSGKTQFTIKLSELCKLISGKNYKGGLKAKLWETIEALHNAEIRLTQPDKKKGPEATVTYVYSPISIGSFKQSSPEKPPTEITLSIFSRTGGTAKDRFSNVAIPKAVLELPMKEFALATCLLIESKQGFQGNDVRASLPELMKAAGLEKTWGSNPRQAKKNLRPKLKRMGERGIIGDFLDFEGNQYAVFKANPLRLSGVKNDLSLGSNGDS